MNSSRSAAPHEPLVSPRLVAALPLVLLLATAVAFLFCPAQSASNLSTVPDAVEYATAAQRLATLGRYDIEINHVGYPPRYSPGFPVLVLAPVYRLFPGDLGNGIYAVLLCGVLGAAAAYAVGRRLGGAWGGALAGLGLLAVPALRQSGRDIMSDVPTLALGLAACCLFLLICERPRLRDYIAAGVVVGIAYTMRAVYVAMWLPFAVLAVRRRDRLAATFTALTAPVLLAYASVGCYNLHAFGQWSRTGYQYWCAVPYDYLWLTFSPAFLGANLGTLATARVALVVVAGATGAWLLWQRDRSGLRRAGAFLVLGAGPISALHLLYFAEGVRFHFLALTGLAILAGAGVGRCVPVRFDRLAWVLPALALPLAAWLAGRPDPPALRRAVAEAIAASTPKDAVVVTALDAVFLEPYLTRGTSRTIVPVSRDVEYAGKLVTPRRIAPLVPPPRSSVDHRAVALIRGGARDVFPFTAEEQPGRLAEMVRSGRPVYVDHSFTAPFGFWSGPNAPFVEEPVEGFPWLRRLRLLSP